MEDEQDKKPKVRPVTFYFYRCSVLKSGNRMMKGLVSYARQSGQNGSAVLLSDDFIDGYRVQMQSLQIDGNLMYGIMRRLRRDNRTIIGSVKRSQERLIPIKEDEYFIEKTHFLYDNNLEVLLYQHNQVGVPHKIFSKYVSRIINGPINFDYLWTKEAHEMLKGGKIKLKEFKIMKIASPTHTGLYQEEDIGWDKPAMDMMHKVDGQTIIITVLANIRRVGGGQKKRFLNPSSIGLLADFVKNINPHEGGVEATFYDPDSGESKTFNFVTDKFQFKVSSNEVGSIMTGKKLDSSKFFEIMKARMKDSQPQLREILKRVND